MQIDRIEDLGADLLDEVSLRVVPVEMVVDLPISAKPDAQIVVDESAMGRTELPHAAKQSLIAQAELEREVIVERGDIRFYGRQKWQERLDLGGEIEGAARDGVVERLDAEAVARDEQALSRRVPDRERKHSAQPLDAILAPPLVG